VRHAFTVARNRPGGLNLGLPNTTVWWQGYSGLSLRDVSRKLKLIKTSGDEPNFILIHCGGNDLGKIPLLKLRGLFNDLLQYILDNFDAKVIWSEILPRKCWRYSENSLAMEEARKRINGHAANKVINSGGFYIKHPDLKDTTPAYYEDDGVHLTFLGNCFFLNQLSAAVEAYQTKGTVYFE